MGTAGSVVQAADSDGEISGDVLGEEVVIRNIPIEYVPRKGKSLSLRSVGSFGKVKDNKKLVNNKSLSLRSAFSMDFDPETEKLRKEFEVFRSNKQTEIKELHTATEKLQNENRRLRGEMRIIQSTYNKMKFERDSALAARDQAILRAISFEKEHSKVQKLFKIFRETKEGEVQQLMKSLRENEHHVQKCKGMQSYDVTSCSDMLSTGHSVEWWMQSCTSDPCIENLNQYPTGNRPEFAQSLVGKEGPFTNISREDWSAVAPTLAQMRSTSMQSKHRKTVFRLFVLSSTDTQHDLQIFSKVFVPQIEKLCEKERKFFTLVHFVNVEDQHNKNSQLMKLQQLRKSDVFLGFLGHKLDRFLCQVIEQGILQKRENVSVICCLKKQLPEKLSVVEREEDILLQSCREQIQHLSQDHGHYNTAEEGGEMAFQFLQKHISSGLNTCEHDCELWCCGEDGSDLEQVEILKHAAKCSCCIGFSKYYDQLNEHMSRTGPLTPLLVMGDTGCGKSLLLAKWIGQQQGRVTSGLVLYHFVTSSTSASSSPYAMIRRFTLQLLGMITTPPPLPCDPAKLIKEFPKLLEKISAKIQGGITIVIDSADRLQDDSKAMSWLLDPLPVETRVLISVQMVCCPKAWRSWPAVNMLPLSSRESVDLVSSAWQNTAVTMSHNEINNQLSKCSPEAISIPQFLSMLVAELSTRLADKPSLLGHFDRCRSAKSCADLVDLVFDHVEEHFQHIMSVHLLRKMLVLVHTSRNGLSESEILSLVPLDWIVWTQLYEEFTQRQLIVERAGLLVFTYEQVGETVKKKYMEDKGIRTEASRDLITYFTSKLQSKSMIFRVADELLWQLQKAGDKVQLKKTLLNIDILSSLFKRGHVSDLMSYWKYLGFDVDEVSDLYFESIKQLDSDETPSIQVCEMFEVLGQFMRGQGLLQEAITPLQRALEISETALDPDHPLVGRCLSNLAGLYTQWGKYSTAEELCKQALEMKENAVGPNHLSLVKELESLSLIYRKQDKPELADPLQKRAISIRQTTGVANIGNDTLKQKSSSVQEMIVGPDSPEIAKSLNELGVLFYLQNDLDSARPCLERALEMRENIVGVDHPDVAQSLHNLAALFNDMKMYSDAEPLYERALNIRLKCLSSDSASVASTIKHLATLYSKQGKYSKAEPLCRKALDIREKSFGGSHPSVATALHNLAITLSQQKKHTDALPLYERALKIYEENFGLGHPSVSETLKNIAKVHFDLGNFETAAIMYRKSTDTGDTEGRDKFRSRCSSQGDFSVHGNHVGSRGLMNHSYKDMSTSYR